MRNVPDKQHRLYESSPLQAEVDRQANLVFSDEECERDPEPHVGNRPPPNYGPQKKTLAQKNQQLQDDLPITFADNKESTTSIENDFDILNRFLRTSNHEAYLDRKLISKIPTLKNKTYEKSKL